MSNPTPLEYGKYYHIYNRGNNRENIFREERNYTYFLKLYAEYIEPIADTYAYCLLYNHFHLAVRLKTLEEQQQTLTKFKEEQNQSGADFTPKKPSQQFSNLFNAYSTTINRTYKRSGALFKRPFGRSEVTSERYLVQLITYIHQNPQKHSLTKDFRTWPYSSYRTLLSHQPTRLQREIVLTWFDGSIGLEQYHHQAIIEHPLAPEDFD